MSSRADVAERVFALLVRAYPTEFRSRYGSEMRLVFRAHLKDSAEKGVRFWMQIVWDVARSAPALRAEAFRSWWQTDSQQGEGKMKPMGILAVLVGLVQIANAMLEWSAGRAQFGGAYSAMGVLLGLVAALLLVGCGVALLRRGWDARGMARIAAIACVALVVLIRIVQPWMSGFGTLLGIGFPIALLVFLFAFEGSSRSGPMTA